MKKDKNGIVEVGSKKINIDSSLKDEEVNYYRDLPYKLNDISIAYWISYQYDIIENKTDYFGAVLLKWLKLGNIKIEEINLPGLFEEREEKYIFLDNVFNLDDSETKLFQMMYESSIDGKIMKNEFNNWCKYNSARILGWFDTIIDKTTKRLIEENKLLYDENTNTYNVSSEINSIATDIRGLKKFLNDFTNIDDKEPINVKILDEYLIYAQIFGIADKVMEEFEKLYPDKLPKLDYGDFKYVHQIVANNKNTIIKAKIIDTMPNVKNLNYNNNNNSFDIMSNINYSSGGGGFSSGGGGRGSFGGGGGGGGFR